MGFSSDPFYELKFYFPPGCFIKLRIETPNIINIAIEAKDNALDCPDVRSPIDPSAKVVSQ